MAKGKEKKVTTVCTRRNCDKCDWDCYSSCPHEMMGLAKIKTYDITITAVERAKEKRGEGKK